MTKPSDLHPALTDHRLTKVAQLIRHARHQAVTRHEPSLGDNAWVLGCRCYAFTCDAIKRAAAAHEWLTIIDGASGGLRFSFAIGGVPIRFYRGLPEDVPEDKARRTFPEIRAIQNAFEFSADFGRGAPHAILLAVETDESGDATRITLVQVDEDSNLVGETWVIGEAEIPDNVAPFRKPEEGKDLGKPVVESRKDKAREEDEE